MLEENLGTHIYLGTSGQIAWLRWKSSAITPMRWTIHQRGIYTLGVLNKLS